jgi:hypothetical protein
MGASRPKPAGGYSALDVESRAFATTLSALASDEIPCIFPDDQGI